MANLVDVHKLIDPQLASLSYYDGQEEPDSYYAKLRTINKTARPLAVAQFNLQRIKPYVQGLVYADILPYLYTHMPQYIEMRLRQANPLNLGAFFTDLRRIWLESKRQITE
ncbi:hypothetical protein GLOIN_2v1765860 [Rhizophagus clarus]|uniref:Uncharacterized protein n=1 Tax=Rhizophagus clarus TaxID=94130 RepID=A0A8H3L3D1_9GLOM|nr:hypothetical protein GLOIN_2v1765860 [Rhizophagus clarus]